MSLKVIRRFMFSLSFSCFFLEFLSMVNLHARMQLWLSALLKQVARMYPKCSSSLILLQTKPLIAVSNIFCLMYVRSFNIRASVKLLVNSSGIVIFEFLGYRVTDLEYSPLMFICVVLFNDSLFKVGTIPFIRKIETVFLIT